MARRDVLPTGPCNNSSVHYVARSIQALKVSQFLGQRASELGMLPNREGMLDLWLNRFWRIHFPWPECFAAAEFCREMGQFIP